MNPIDWPLFPLSLFWLCVIGLLVAILPVVLLIREGIDWQREEMARRQADKTSEPTP